MESQIELIKIHEHHNKRLVDARELHAFLGSKQEFPAWIKSRIEKYGFIDGQDYTTFDKIIKRGNRSGASKRMEYALTLDMSKEVCMVENNDKGRQARLYFIAKEKEANSKTVALPSRKELAMMVLQAEEQIEQLALVNTKQEKIINVLAPKAEIYDKAMETSGLYEIGKVAKLLNLPFGRNILCRKLREDGYFFKNTNEPIQYYIANNFFDYKKKEIEVTKKDGTQYKMIVYKKWVTTKGLELIAKTYGSYKGEGIQKALSF